VAAFEKYHYKLQSYHRTKPKVTVKIGVKPGRNRKFPLTHPELMLHLHVAFANNFPPRSELWSSQVSGAEVSDTAGQNFCGKGFDTYGRIA
jgi:hypothetical protein